MYKKKYCVKAVFCRLIFTESLQFDLLYSPTFDLLIQNLANSVTDKYCSWIQRHYCDIIISPSLRWLKKVIYYKAICNRKYLLIVLHVLEWNEVIHFYQNIQYDSYNMSQQIHTCWLQIYLVTKCTLPVWPLYSIFHLSCDWTSISITLLQALFLIHDSIEIIPKC